MMRNLWISLTCITLVGCASTSSKKFAMLPSSPYLARISVQDQAMDLSSNGVFVARYPISTSKFGLGDEYNSYRTPLGLFVIQDKIGDGIPKGGKFYRRKFTGRIVDLAHYNPNAPDYRHDSILTRILWLRGLESSNQNAYDRGIYIHGTNQEKEVGKPVSYGCIRMRNDDVLNVFETIPAGTRVLIQTATLSPTTPASIASISQQTNIKTEATMETVMR